LAGKVQPDVSSQITSSQRFSYFRQIISDQKYSNFNTANSTSLNAGVSVVGYVDAFLGTTSNANTWSTNWNNFVKSTYSQASESFNSNLYVSQWSVDLVKAIVSACPGKGFYGLLQSVTDAHDAFSFSLHGTGSWKLTGVNVSPPDPNFLCGGYEKASVSTPSDLINDVVISCSKSPDKTSIVTVHSSEGDAGPFTILSASESRIDQANADLEAARSALASMTAQRDAAIAANAAAAAEVKSLVASIQTVFPNGPQLSGSVASITQLVTNSCGGGPHGVDPAHASAIRQISTDTAQAISSAATAITGIVASVPPEYTR
jgi:hypothetical protein